MEEPQWHIYLGKIPFSEGNNFWVSFESDPRLTKTKSNIYNRCLPCIQNLYDQLKTGCSAIKLGNAYQCWKITAVLKGIEACQALLFEYEQKFPGPHVYGKFGSGHPNSPTHVVVFHAESVKERDRIRSTLKQCIKKIDKNAHIKISRACGVLYDDLLGDWRHWRPTTAIKNPEFADQLLERVKRILFRARI